MSRADTIQVEGKVTKTLPGGKFKVELENGKEVICTLNGKIRINNIKIMEGDSVTVEFSPYSLELGRIVYRTK